MKELAAAIAVFVLSLIVLEVDAEVVGRVNEQGFIVVTAEGEQFAGLDFISAGGHLIPDSSMPPDASPFGQYLINTNQHVTLATIGEFVTINGDLVTKIGFEQQADPVTDLSARWGGRTGPPVDFPVHPTPRVSQVLVGADDWSSPFRELLGNEGFYPVSMQSPPPTRVPWRINQIRMVFNDDVRVGQSDLQLLNSGPSPIGIQSFEYAPTSRTATWSIDPVTADRLLFSVSDQVASRLSSLPLAGADSAYQLDVLAGDVDRNGTNSLNDLQTVASFWQQPTSPNNVFVDLDGSGQVTLNDLQLLASNWNRSLPEQPPGGPPRITQLLVRSSAWSPEFSDLLDDTGGFYPLPIGSGDPPTPVPWSIDEVRVVFNEEVTVARNDLRLENTAPNAVNVRAFEYAGGQRAATWSIDPVSADKLLLTVSENVASQRGNLPLSGGDASFRVDVLAGDADRSGANSLNDLQLLASYWQQPTEEGTLFADFDGSGQLTLNDLQILASFWGEALPNIQAGDPRVTQVLVGSTRWSPDFRALLDGAGGFHPLPIDEQGRVLPWSIDQVRLVFNKDVNVSEDDLELASVAVDAVAVLDFAYADGVATWTIDPVAADKLLLSVSEAVTSAADIPPNGAATEDDVAAAGNSIFQIRVDVLAGDADGSGATSLNDLQSLATNWQQSTDAESLFVDFDGSGQLTLNDLQLLASNWGRRLPDAEPVLASPLVAAMAMPDTTTLTPRPSVPEPSSGWLLASGMLLARRRQGTT